MSQVHMFPLKGGSPPTTLTSNISQTDTRLDVADVSVFPDIGDTNNLVSIWVSTTSGKVWEVCEYTAKVVTTSPAGYLTIIRSGANHSSSSSGTALSWSSGAKCARNVNKLDFDKIQANIKDLATRTTSTEATITATAEAVVSHEENTSNPHGVTCDQIGAGYRENLIINGGFTINQVAYTSGTARSAGGYCHDMWKAGSSGCTYGFTQLKSPTQITITAGSLIQIIEDCDVLGGTYILSWEGTALARVGINTATPSGDYVVSPILISNQSAGTVMSVEFSTGTVGKVKLESGTISTPFTLNNSIEIMKCRRYCQPIGLTGADRMGLGFANSATQIDFVTKLIPPMRTTPSIIIPDVTKITIAGIGGSSATAATLDSGASSASEITISITTSGKTAGNAYLVINDANSPIILSARL